MVKKDTKVDQSGLKAQALDEIINKLIEAHKRGEATDLNKLKSSTSRQLGLGGHLKLVDIIAAGRFFYLLATSCCIQGSPLQNHSLSLCFSSS